MARLYSIIFFEDLNLFITNRVDYIKMHCKCKYALFSVKSKRQHLSLQKPFDSFYLIFFPLKLPFPLLNWDPLYARDKRARLGYSLRFGSRKWGNLVQRLYNNLNSQPICLFLSSSLSFSLLLSLSLSLSPHFFSLSLHFLSLSFSNFTVPLFFFNLNQYLSFILSRPLFFFFLYLSFLPFLYDSFLSRWFSLSPYCADLFNWQFIWFWYVRVSSFPSRIWTFQKSNRRQV